MKLELIYKSYTNSRGRWKKGDVEDFAHDEATRLLKQFPEWWVPAEHKPEVPAPPHIPDEPHDVEVADASDHEDPFIASDEFMDE